jgi:hypothetical protein
MKKATVTKRNLPNWHESNLAQRTRRRAKRRKIRYENYLEKITLSADHDKKLARRVDVDTKTSNMQQQIAEIGIDPKYLSSHERARIFINIGENDIIANYKENLKQYKATLHRKDVAKYREEHPDSTIMSRAL